MPRDAYNYISMILALLKAIILIMTELQQLLGEIRAPLLTCLLKFSMQLIRSQTLLSKMFGPLEL
jgi:hypothetical protein